jgi:hypothetical protein
MATDPVIKKRLLEHLGIKRQSLETRVKTIKRQTPISTEDAVYLIAFREEVPIDDRLDPDTLERIGRYQTKLTPQIDQPKAARPGKTSRQRPPTPTVVRIANVSVEDLPGMTPTHAREGKLMAERVYPILYVFENSARDVITRVLEAALGPDWWDQVSWSDARGEVKRRKAMEGKDAWHSKRGEGPLDYLDLGQLVELVGKPKVWPYFSSIFPRENWFAGVVDDLTVSRRVIAHMNPLTTEDIEQVEAGFKRWVKQIKAKADLIP